MTVSRLDCRQDSGGGIAGRLRAAAAAMLVCVALGACTGEQFQKGYILPEGALEQIPIGASQDQVLIVMGTPSTVATLSGEVFYYISQRAERKVAFMPQNVVDQRVIAIYFYKNRTVQHRQLRPAGRQDLRLHQPHDADQRPGTELPHAAVQAAEPALTVDNATPSPPPAFGLVHRAPS
jgi:outer membrane protein assembly factor BamE (lipoprotein component of BamABCDE complex)